MFGVSLIKCVCRADSNSAVMDLRRWSASEMSIGGEDSNWERKIRSELYSRPSLISIKQ